MSDIEARVVPEEVMREKDLRRVVAGYLQDGAAVAMVRLREAKDGAAGRVEAEFDGPVNGVGSPFEFDVRARDKGGPAPVKGERPWHYYRVTVTEHQTARG